jgi:hypothetical protein
MWRYRYLNGKIVTRSVVGLIAIFAVAVMVLPAVGGVTSTVSSQVTLPAMAPANHIIAPATTCNGIVTSSSGNWGGYAVQSCLKSPSKDVVTKVVGSWVEPAVKCTKTSLSGFWVGIDGYTSTSVEQTGTAAGCTGTSPYYYAWYEMYPASPVTISKMKVTPGDTLTASVTYNSAKKFVLAIKDVTTGVSFSIAKALASAARSSAEWIVEVPGSALADFGTVTFSGCSATISGVTGPIQTSTSTWEAADLSIGTSTTHQETTGSLNSAGNGFTATWLAL